MTAREDLSSEVRYPNIESTYHLKWVQWNSGKVPIVMQRINGPCPLIAIMNVLLFREKVKLPTMLEQITAHQLMTYLGECIMDSVPEDMQNNEDALLNLEQNIHDAIEILPKLQTGLDVNIRFSGISDFEYTPECIIFDLLRIPLFHGWLSDPSMPEVQRVVGHLSYNQLVDSIITGKTSIEAETVARVLIAEDFLEKTASQLTHYGLNQLKNQIKDNELGILFRNNHFVTLFKRDGNLYQLVTDHGFLTESIIWETLDNIEGDGKFVDCNFETIDIKDKETASLDKKLQQLENDYLMALSLKEEETGDTGQIENRPLDWTTFPTERKNGIVSFQDPSKEWTEESDFEFAQRLQAEETRMYQAQPASMQTKPDIIVDDHCQGKECREDNAQNTPSSPEPGPSRAESVINVQADSKTTEDSERQLGCKDLVNHAQPCHVNSQSNILDHEGTSSPQQGSSDAIVEQSQNQLNAISKLHSSASESQLTGSDYSHIGGNPDNQSHLIEAYGEDLETRQRRASYNQSILAASQVPTMDARLHHQQNSLPGRPNSKLARASLRSSDSNKSCALM